jgi:integrase
MATRREAGASVALVRYARTVLRIALNIAVARKHVAWNVASVVKPPKRDAADRRAIRPLTVAEAQALLTALRGRRHEALLTAGLAIGLRLGEALGLKEDDLDLEAGVVHVRRQLQAIPGKTRDPKTGRRRQRLELVDLKTAKSQRTIPLPAVTVAAFKAQRVAQLRARLKAGALWQEQGLVFTTRTGGPMQPRNALRDFQRVLRAAGLPIVRFPDLRIPSPRCCSYKASNRVWDGDPGPLRDPGDARPLSARPARRPTRRGEPDRSPAEDHGVGHQPAS